MPLFPIHQSVPQQPTPPAMPPTTGLLAKDDVARARQLADLLRARFAQTLVGQDNLRESLIVTLVAGGHILIESVPGLAKTTAAQTLATAVSGTFKRVQCTPDLMPSDLVGTQVFDFASQRFATQIGPIHANLSVKHRAQILAVDDDEALEAAFELTRLEGIIPALESAHALGALAKVNFKPEEVVVLTVSGRGDKDMDTYINYKLS